MIRQPIKIKSNPESLIPWHGAGATLYFKELYSLSRFDKIPPIPVVLAPTDLQDVGSYVIYNGHHRKASAIETKVEPECFLICSDNDILYLEEKTESYPELLEGLEKKFEAHYNQVCDMARYYQVITEIKEGKKPIMRNVNTPLIRQQISKLIEIYSSRRIDFS